MSLSVERLEELADNEAACAESLLNCRDYDDDEDLKTERQARLDTEAGLRELIAIKKEKPVYCVPEEVVGEAGECIKYGHYDVPPPLCDFFTLIRKP